MEPPGLRVRRCSFGGVVPTPALDRIANAGLRYTQFHSTSLCSPTRAALITGRNHHVAGFGVVGEAATGFPGYDSIIRKDAGTVGTILRDNGYATSWFGKDHNTPFYQTSQAGPFDQWPNGMGFDYFYGFVGGDTSQWQPNLFVGTRTPVTKSGDFLIAGPNWNGTALEGIKETFRFSTRYAWVLVQISVDTRGTAAHSA